MYSNPLVVLLEITTQLLPTGHNGVHTKLLPDPDEVYPGKHVQDVVSGADDEPNGQAVQTKLLPDPDEVYPGKQVQDEDPAVDDEPNGQAVQTKLLPDPKE
jgi:hypothetical protein